MPPPYELHKKKMVKFVSLNYKHVFSFEYLYERLHEWLIDEGYMTTSDDKWIEKLYLERVSGNGAKQIWVWWRTDKMWPGGFIKYYFDIDFHVLGLTSAEIVHEGNKVKTDKGECEVFVTAYMEIDPSKGWDTNILLKNEYLRNFFLNRIYKAKIEEAEDNLIKDTSRLLGAVKQYFQLESFIPEYAEKPFFPAKGL